MKRLITSVIAGTFLLTSTVLPTRNAHAAAAGIVALASGPAVPVLIAAGVAGGVTVFSWTVGCMIEDAVADNQCTRNEHAGVATAIALVAGAIGLVLLDGRSGGFSYATLDEQTAAELGVSARTAEIYNSELPELNAVFQTVIQDAKSAESLRPEVIQALWTENAANLSSETMEVVTRIADQLNQTAAK